MNIVLLLIYVDSLQRVLDYTSKILQFVYISDIAGKKEYPVHRSCYIRLDVDKLVYNLVQSQRVWFILWCFS